MKPGSYTLTAKATDKSNPAGRNLSAPITITVNPPEPTGNGYWDAVFGNNSTFTYARLLSAAVDTNSAVLVGSDTGNQSGVTGLLNKWSSCVWSQVRTQDGGSTRVWSLEPYGTDLYFGGNLEQENLPDTYVVRWDGTNWFAVGNGLGLAATNHDGARVVRVVKGDVYVGGDFTSAGGNTNIQYIARLTIGTTNWTAVGNGLNWKVRAIAHIGDTLYVGGDFTSAAANTNIQYLAKWSGTTWTNVGIGVNGIVHTLAVQGTDLFVGGEFTTAGGLTNAIGIAKWDGISWSAVGGGLTDGISDCVPPGEGQGPDCPTNSVEAIVVRGNELYAGGEFTKAWNGTNSLIVNYVAKATWSAESQTWTWSALDSGIGGNNGFNNSPHLIRVRGLALRERNNTNGYDLIVVGWFNLAGSLHAENVARWVVGPSDCPTSGPSVSITVPANYSSLDQGTINLTAHATTTSGAISNVQFYADGSFLANGLPRGGDDYTNSWSSPSVGSHTLVAIAQDDQKRFASSAPTYLTIKPASGPNVANDTFTVFSNGPATNLNVLANDSSANGPLRIVGVSRLHNPWSNVRLGTVRIGYGATNLIYQAFPNTFGTDVLDYSVADNAGTNSGYATINIRSLPQASITTPTNGTVYLTNSVSITVSGTSKDYDGSISNVTLYVNGLPYGSPTTSTDFNLSFSTNAGGFYTLVALARDNDGFTNGSPPVTITIDPPNTSPPFADITGLANDTTNYSTLTYTNYPVLRDGFVNLQGLWN